MLDYIVTVAISAYFVPNYLSVFWPVLKTFPYNSIGGIVTILALVGINVFGIKEAAAPQRRPRAPGPRHADPADGPRRGAAACSPSC